MDSRNHIPDTNDTSGSFDSLAILSEDPFRDHFTARCVGYEQSRAAIKKHDESFIQETLSSFDNEAVSFYPVVRMQKANSLCTGFEGGSLEPESD